MLWDCCLGTWSIPDTHCPVFSPPESHLRPQRPDIPPLGLRHLGLFSIALNQGPPNTYHVKPWNWPRKPVPAITTSCLLLLRTWHSFEVGLVSAKLKGNMKLESKSCVAVRNLG